MRFQVLDSEVFLDEVCTPEWNGLLKKLIIERLQEFDIPILFDLPIGHLSGNACIPLGCEATLNGNDGELIVHILLIKNLLKIVFAIFRSSGEVIFIFAEFPQYFYLPI